MPLGHMLNPTSLNFPWALRTDSLDATGPLLPRWRLFHRIAMMRKIPKILSYEAPPIQRVPWTLHFAVTRSWSWSWSNYDYLSFILTAAAILETGFYLKPIHQELGQFCSLSATKWTMTNDEGLIPKSIRQIMHILHQNHIHMRPQ